MTTKRKHRRKGDPLIPFDRRTLRAAYQALDPPVSVRQLAREVGTLPQTLNYLLGDRRNRRCRKSLLARLAKRLDVREQVLSGESAIFWGVQVEEMFAADQVGVPARAQFAQHRFFTRCQQAWARDLQAVHATPAARRRLDAEFAFTILDLVRPEQWRRRLLADRAAARISDAESDRIAPALATALEEILRPWFDGTARLDLGNLRRWRVDFLRARPQIAPSAIVGRRQGNRYGKSQHTVKSGHSRNRPRSQTVGNVTTARPGA